MATSPSSEAFPTGAAAMEVDAVASRPELFSLEIMVEGFLTVDSMGRKVYSKGKVLKWDVEIGSFSVELLMISLKNEVKWAPNQSATVWFFHKRLGEDIRLTEEVQMRELFEMYESEMRCHVIVVVLDNSKIAEVVESDELEPLCVVPPDDGVPANPTGVSAAKEVDVPETDLFDNEEEYVGVDDEHMYTVPTSPAAASQPSAQQPDPSHAHHTESHENVPDAEGVVGGEHVEAEVNDADPQEFNVIHDPENPNIENGALFPDIVTFRKAVRHYAVKRGFEFRDLKTDKTRFIAKCAHIGCPWRIHASTIYDKKTIEIKVLPAEHNCPTTKLRESKMTTQGWVADRLSEWVKNNPSKGPKDAKEKVEGDYGIKLRYSKAWSGLKLALEQVHGKYEESFQYLFNWKAQMEINSPGSIIEIDVERKNKKMRFRRIFVALKPCVDGFLVGCRPYIGVDATKLNGKYTGQLASATSVDGHSWLYHLAYAVFDSETEDNWIWFMEQLQRAVGTPDGLVICTDACKGLETTVGAVFPTAEYRECMRHLYGNFMKYYQGDVFTEHLYPAARSYTEGLFKWQYEENI